jgi:hypothetical protein
VAVAIIGFGSAFALQWTKVSDAVEKRTQCEDTLGKHSRTMETQGALLSLYRARHQIGQNNFGMAGEQIQIAKSKLGSAAVTGEAVTEVERAAALTAANDAAAIDAIQKAIAALETK